MAKKLVQDVLPPNKKTIRQIPITRRRDEEPIQTKSDVSANAPKQIKSDVTITPKQPAKKNVDIIPSEKLTPPPPSTRERIARFKNYKFFFVVIFFLALAALLASGFTLSRRAEITVEPKQSKLTIDVTLQSKQSGSAEELSHQLIMASSTQSEAVKATAEKMVSRKASGTIVVYNNFSTAEQRLIKNTRFESKDGKIYRIDNSITIPGQKTENGKTVPGQLQVVVYADMPGAEYNMKVSDLKGDFTIPGFKGTPRYNAFYGRQKTDIVGGFTGMAKVVDEATASLVSDRLKNKVRDELWLSTNSTLPKNFILYPSAFFVEFGQVTQTETEGDSVKFELSAVSRAIVFEKTELGSAAAKKVFSNYDNNPVIIENGSGLEFIPKTSNNQKIWEANPLIFSLKGDAGFVWQFDPTKLSADLAAKPKNSTNIVLADYPSIMRAEVVIKPFWYKKYPPNPDHIKILRKLD